jgi:hypothetical protein
VGGGAEPGERTAVILPTTMRDFAVAAGIAASAFGIAAAAPLGIYGVMVLVFGAITVYMSKRADGGAPPVADGSGAHRRPSLDRPR